MMWMWQGVNVSSPDLRNSGQDGEEDDGLVEVSKEPRQSMTLPPGPSRAVT
jgi:hypothetical protein